MKTIDRYVIREIIPPLLIALLVFTFILIIPFIIELAEQLIAKGVPWPILGQMMWTLVPQALGLTIPMALLIGILVGFGRLSADREIVVLMACGVSPYRMLRPVLVLGVVAWAACSWVMIKSIPDANQTFRELRLNVLVDRAEGEVRPRVFFEDFPNLVLYARDVPASGGWNDVIAADTGNPAQPVIYLARRGRLLVDRQAKTIHMVLEEGTRHSTKIIDPAFYEVLNFERTVLTLDPEQVFPRKGPARGDRELSIAELRERIAELDKEGLSPHNQVMEIHKKFSIPIACFIFAVLGLALGASSRKDGKLASFVLGIAVILVYYVLLFTSQSLTKGHYIPAWLAMWIPNLALGAAGALLLMSRARSADQPIQIAVPAWLRLPWRAGAAAGEGTPAPAAPASTAPARRGVVLVIRVPQFQLPRPKLLDLYVAAQYGRILLITVAAMLSLFYISTFIDMSDKWFKGETSLGQLMRFLWYSTPQFMAYILAIAVLLSALVTIGLLTKNSELIVMRACGISLYRTSVPLLAFALVTSAALFGMEERVLGLSNRQADRLKHLIRGGSPQTFDVMMRRWIVGRNGDIYYYQHYDPRRQELNMLSVMSFDLDSRTLLRRVQASRATWLAAESRAAGAPQWRLDTGWVREFGPGNQVKVFDRFETAVRTLDGPDYFVSEEPEPRRMTYPQLQVYIKELQQSGYDVVEHQVELHRKTAFPLVPVVMTLIAVPFAVTTGRRGALYGIGVGIVLALVYWTMISVFAAFGQGGLIAPALAAWAPNLLFAAAAAYLILTVRT